MKLSKLTYLSKVRGCFVGKNIGGTLGGPFEGKKELLNITGFITQKGEPLPNDDLDLQLVWLQAVEDEGPQHINSEILGEYWMSFITPYWNEYGISKINMSRGINPSVAGDMDNNIWKHSNGAWIRTEIWACLCPGAIDTAVKYAIEDALVDHGIGEGTYAAAFVAALESAAFFENDINKLINIGLAKINEKSRVYSTVKFVVDEFNKGTDWKETRNKIIELNKDIGDGWFQAPNNIGFVVIGLLYGDGDFKKSMLTAVNCGDDTDCTAATIGSIMGIVYGEENIPQDWKEYIGDRIITCSINKGCSFRFCWTITELVTRISKQVNYVLYANKDKVEISDEETSITELEKASFMNKWAINDERDDVRSLRYSLKENTFKTKTGVLTTIVTYKDGVNYINGDIKQLEIMVTNNIKAYGNQGHQVRFELLLPEGIDCLSKAKETYVPCWTPMTMMAHSESIKFDLNFNNVNDSNVTMLLKVTILPRQKEYFIPIKFLQK